MSYSGGSMTVVSLPFRSDSISSVFKNESKENCSVAGEMGVKESARDKYLPDSILSLIRKGSIGNCSVTDERGVKESASDNQHMLPSSKVAPTVLTEKSSNEGPTNNSGGCASGPFILNPFKQKETSVPISSGFRIDWEEIDSNLHKKVEKKNSKDKKHINEVTSSTDKAVQKRRRKRYSLFNTEERFEDKMPYVCFECKKTFGYYSSLDEHELSHVLKKIWHE